jgi:hypothetical protein
MKINNPNEIPIGFLIHMAAELHNTLMQSLQLLKANDIDHDKLREQIFFEVNTIRLLTDVMSDDTGSIHEEYRYDDLPILEYIAEQLLPTLDEGSRKTFEAMKKAYDDNGQEGGIA